MVACFTEFEQDLIYLLTKLSIEIRKQNAKGLVTAIYIFQETPEEDNTISNRSEGSLSDVSLLPETHEETPKYLFAVLIGDIAANGLDLLADVPQRGDGGPLDVQIAMH